MRVLLISQRLLMGMFIVIATAGQAWAQRASIDDYGYEGTMGVGPIQGFLGLLFFIVLVLLCLPRGSPGEFLGALVRLIFWFGALVASAQFGVLGPIITGVIFIFWLNWRLDPARRAHRPQSSLPPKAERQALQHTPEPERQQAIDAEKISREKEQE
jgi:hypothetical protein